MSKGRTQDDARLYGLDEAIADLAAAKANADQNLRNARAIVESYLQSVFSHRGEGLGGDTVKSIAVPGVERRTLSPRLWPSVHRAFSHPTTSDAAVTAAVSPLCPVAQSPCWHLGVLSYR
jgi:hypothetical protein